MKLYVLVNDDFFITSGPFVNRPNPEDVLSFERIVEFDSSDSEWQEFLSFYPEILEIVNHE